MWDIPNQKQLNAETESKKTLAIQLSTLESLEGGLGKVRDGGVSKLADTVLQEPIAKFFWICEPVFSVLFVEETIFVPLWILRTLVKKSVIGHIWMGL